MVMTPERRAEIEEYRVVLLSSYSMGSHGLTEAARAIGALLAEIDEMSQDHRKFIKEIHRLLDQLHVQTSCHSVWEGRAARYKAERDALADQLREQIHDNSHKLVPYDARYHQSMTFTHASGRVGHGWLICTKPDCGYALPGRGWCSEHKALDACWAQRVADANEEETTL